jgi:hypothetical protein
MTQLVPHSSAFHLSYKNQSVDVLYSKTHTYILQAESKSSERETWQY